MDLITMFKEMGELDIRKEFFYEITTKNRKAYFDKVISEWKEYIEDLLREKDFIRPLRKRKNINRTVKDVIGDLDKEIGWVKCEIKRLQSISDKLLTQLKNEKKEDSQTSPQG